MDISNLQKEASLKKPVWEKWFRKNKQRLMKMDSEVQQLHNEAVADTDCLACGNCCRSLGPMILTGDIDLMAKALRVKTAAIIDRYLQCDEDGDMVFRSMPCPFLGDDNYCSIYESRPRACREYPHTDRKKFYQIYSLSLKNAETCPIVHKVLDRLTAGE
ncbi:MAG: YkgJ family cysteine cluster protein [Proteiniphilum sp.]|nr:YkgJ family cysteine cluster protein [Proteiniphilum sp.]